MRKACAARDYRNRRRAPETDAVRTVHGGQAPELSNRKLLCTARVRKWPLAAVTIDPLGTTGFEGAADQMWF
jgi:hypothetical protein